MNIMASIEIAAPVTEVFEVFTDLARAADRITGIEKIEILEGPSQMEVGTKWKETRTMFGKEATEVMWVTELEKNRRMVAEAESHGTHYRSEYVFTEIDGSVKVALDFIGTPLSVGAKFLGILGFIFAGSMRKMLLADMKDLQKVCEGR